MVGNDNEQGILDLQETIHDLLQHPINLNTSNEQEMIDCGLFSSYQVYGILRHREEFGSFFTIYEMISIPGFQKDFLEDIHSLVSFTETDILKRQTSRKGLYMTNIYNKFPNSAAYSSSDTTASAYPGSPFKISSRFKLDLGDKINLGAAYEKDAGENAIQHWKPEHITGYIKYSPGRFLRSITLGNYRIHTGMGLVHGLGFSSGGNGVQLNGFRTSYSKPFASTAEYDYYRGAIAEIGIKKWTCRAYYSYKAEDISLFGISDFIQTYDLFEAKRETGLHRTKTEKSGKDLANQHTAGISMNRNHQHLNYGISASGNIMKASNALIDSIPFIENTKNRKWNLSAYALAYGGKFEVYGEFATNETLSPAFIFGGHVAANAALSFYTSFRYYHPKYRGQIPGAYGTGSETANETGFNSGLLIIPFNNALITLDTDVCYFPTASYYLSTPGFYIRNKLELRYRFLNGSEIIARYSNRIRQLDENRFTQGTSVSVVNSKTQWRLHYTLPITEKLKLGGRMEWSVSGKNNFGSLIYQQIQIKNNEWASLTYRFTLFDIDTWENRIYCYEPGVRYSFLFPSYYGKGLKNSFVLSVKFSRWLTLRARLGHIHYAYKWEIGSGIDIREGDQTLEAEFQLQLSF